MEKYRKHLLRLKAQGKRKLQKAIGINRIEAYDGQFVTFKFNECNISKGSFYHHFPNGKEELLLACLEGMSEAITTDIEDIFKQYPTAQEATKKMIEKLVANFEREGTIAGYTFTSIVSEMGSVSESVRNACSSLYIRMQEIYTTKLVADGFSKEAANSIALMMTASIEGGILLCLTQEASNPLKVVSHELPKLLKKF